MPHLRSDYTERSDWYSLIEDAARDMGAGVEDGALTVSSGVLDRNIERISAAQQVRLPDIYAHTAPAAQRPAQPIAPSLLPGAKTLASETTADPLAAVKGSFLHRLLELFPQRSEQERQDIVARIGDEFTGLPDKEHHVQKAIRLLSLIHI